MSTLEDSQALWSNLNKEPLDSRYEKCRNITEEIYKRINITFQIKKLETTTQSEFSDINNSDDQIDSNEISNETDLFACDKTSISSSTEPEKTNKSVDSIKPANEKYININNNEEPKVKKPIVVYRRPKKRFRKRVKKRQTKSNLSDTDGSSDEKLAPGRVVDVDKRDSGDDTKDDALDNVMGVPKIVIMTKDLKQKIYSPEQKTTKKNIDNRKKRDVKNENTEKDNVDESKDKVKSSGDTLESGNTADLSAVADGKSAADVKRDADGNDCIKSDLNCKETRRLRRNIMQQYNEDPNVPQN